VRLLLAAAPAPPARPHASSALHWAARGGCPTTVRLLLDAAVALAAAPDDTACLPLHWAARYCHADAARLLLEAAPKAAALRNLRGQLPLDALLASTAASMPAGSKQEAAALATARALLAAPAQSASALLQSLALAKGSWLAQQLYTEVVATHACHLGDWQLVPMACPGLAAALPAVLQRSEWEAAQLTRRLPAPEAARLRVAALALNRAQTRTGLPLPQPLVWRILALTCTSEEGCC
jgi:ankyrin repeat protein